MRCKRGRPPERSLPAPTAPRLTGAQMGAWRLGARVVVGHQLGVRAIAAAKPGRCQRRQAEHRYRPAMDRSAASVVLALGTLVLIGEVVGIVNDIRDDDPTALLPRLLIMLLVVLAMRGARRKLRAAHQE
jgi:hypothetical protein